MADETTRLELTLMRAAKPEGKDYFRCEFEEDFDLGEYHGNQVMTWKNDAALVPPFLEKAKGKLLVIDVKPSSTNAKWSPSLVSAAVKDTGEIVFTQAPYTGSGGGGGKGGKGGGGGGNWESANERLFKNLSIEAQGSLGRLTELAKSFTWVDNGSGVGMVKFNTDGFNEAVSAILVAMDSFPAVVREAAEKSPGGKPEDALKAVPQPAPAAATVSQAAAPKDPKLELVNTALSHYKTVNKVKAAWEDAFQGDAPDKLTDMEPDELEYLIKNATTAALQPEA
jgi:hypothetical protein